LGQTLLEGSAETYVCSSLIWAEDRIAVSCIADPRCVQGHAEAVDLPIQQRPGDIPLWKIFTLTYVSLR
jgi:hypothetical protein